MAEVGGVGLFKINNSIFPSLTNLHTILVKFKWIGFIIDCIFLTLGLSTCDMVAKGKRGITVRHFRNMKGTGAEMCPAVFLLITTGDVLVSYWPMFFLSLVTVPEVFAKVNSTQFSSHIFSSQ